MKTLKTFLAALIILSVAGSVSAKQGNLVDKAKEAGKTAKDKKKVAKKGDDKKDMAVKGAGVPQNTGTKQTTTNTTPASGTNH